MIKKKIKLLALSETGGIVLAGVKGVATKGAQLTIQPRVFITRQVCKDLVMKLCDDAVWVRDKKDCYFQVPEVTKGLLAEISEEVRKILGEPFEKAVGGPSKDQLALSKVSFLTRTAKMGCYSFNLPAGPPDLGGACPASTSGFLYSGRYEGRTYKDFEAFVPNKGTGSISKQLWICNACYALKNNYQYTSIILGQMIKFELVRRMLRPGGWKGRDFASYMVEAIETARRHSRKELSQTPEQLRHHIPHPDYFRIHDSGDFFQESYWDQWVTVMENLPDVHFWAPTRMWSLEKPLRYLRKGPSTKNLALRPSALHFGGPPPNVRGLAEGASSAPVGQTPATAWACPAYEQENLFGGSARARVVEGSGKRRVVKEGFYYCQGSDGKWRQVSDDLTGCQVDRAGRPKFRMEAGNCQRAHGPASPALQQKRKLPVIDQRDLPVSLGGFGCRACWDTTTVVYYQEH